MTKHLTMLVLMAVAPAAVGCGGGGSTPERRAALPLPPMHRATSLQQAFVSVVRAVSPSVVQIRTPHDLGSGIVFDAHGDVVTNAHVVGNATRFVVTLASGDSHAATAVGRDVPNDLAVIRIT